MTVLDRPTMLGDLADCINELCEVRTHSEIIEAEERDGDTRRRVRRRRTETFPALLDELTQAMSPSSGEDGAAAGFESRPAAELEPIQVMELITTQTAKWVTLLGTEKRSTLKGRLHGLVGAQFTDVQLHTLLKDAKYWVRRARVATGWDESPFTIGEPCPSCWRRNALKVAATLDYAVCQRCGVDWPTEHIGLLSQILEQNRTHETLAEPQPRCDAVSDPDSCYLRGGHDGDHHGHTGRYWRDQAA